MPKEKNQKNMEISVISSLGPMASTNIAALLEKFGFLNIPVRKLELSKYLLNKIDIDNNLILAKIEEIEAAEPMRLLRIERNQKLAETDWVTLKAYSQGVEVPLTWKNYMQALRDLPANSEPQLDEQGNLTSVTWPEVPE